MGKWHRNENRDYPENEKREIRKKHSSFILFLKRVILFEIFFFSIIRFEILNRNYPENGMREIKKKHSSFILLLKQVILFENSF